MVCTMAFVLQLHNIKQQRMIFGNMSHKVQQLPTSVISQELTNTPDASAQMTLMQSRIALSALFTVNSVVSAHF